MSSVRILKSTPIVDMNDSAKKESSVKRSKKQDFPTPLSPITRIFRRRSYSAVDRVFSACFLKAAFAPKVKIPPPSLEEADAGAGAADPAAGAGDGDGELEGLPDIFLINELNNDILCKTHAWSKTDGKNV
jgi:hypothetical protein